MPFLKEPISPWLDSKTPLELLPERQMIYPYKPFLEHLNKEIVSFNYCVKIDEFVICLDPIDQMGAQRTCQAIGGELVVFERRFSRIVQKSGTGCRIGFPSGSTVGSLLGEPYQLRGVVVWSIADAILKRANIALVGFKNPS